MNKRTKRKLAVLIITLVAVSAISITTIFVFKSNVLKTNSSNITNATTKVTSTDTDNSADLDWSELKTQEVTLSNTVLNITSAGIYKLTGSTNAGIVVNCEGNVKLILDNANIESSNTPAIYIQNSKNVVIETVDGTINNIQDGTNRTDQNLDGAIYSADDLFFEGNGQLIITAKYADAIVSNDDLTISSGTISISGADDGIKGRDSVRISGGNISISATGDGIKSTNDTDSSKGYVAVSGGDITISAGDDGIHAEESVVVDGGSITIPTSREGIEGSCITINKGNVNIYASDDGMNAPGSTFTDAVITINGGNLVIKVGQGDTDAIDVNGSVYINGGIINITAQTSSIDYDDEAQLNGGTVTVNGEVISEIPKDQMGGGFRR